MNNIPDCDGPDEIITEVRAAREALASEYGYDVRRLFAELNRRAQASDRPKVAPSPKQPVPTHLPDPPLSVAGGQEGDGDFSR